MDVSALAGRRVLVTGHTGFKGAWTALWLHDVGARVTGFALPAEDPSLFRAARLDELCDSVEGDVRDATAVDAVVRRADPDVVLHLAAQPLVRRSYAEPVETVATNVLGTAHVLDAVRRRGRPCVVVVVTSDKCYEEREDGRPYTEDDRMGGADPYSSSKGMAEILCSSWRRSFFPVSRLADHGVALATVRAGNVVGGGDFAADRIVPDAVRALVADRPLAVRNPQATRPWQHVVEPLRGYLGLAAELVRAPRPELCDAFNFGPESSATVEALLTRLFAAWGGGRTVPMAPGPYEAPRLRLSCERARERLGWAPRWDLDETVGRTVRWYRAWADGADASALRDLCRAGIAEGSAR